MKNFKVLLSLTIALTAYKLSYSQHQDVTANTLSSRLDNIKATMIINRDDSKNVKGSPFINDMFEAVTIKRFGNAIFAGRYNANLKEMQIQRTTDTIALNTSENYEVTFALSKKKYKTYNYTTEKAISQQGFLVVLHESDSLALLKEENIKYYKEIPAVTSYDRTKPAEYKRIDDEYYYSVGGSAFFLPRKKKDFLKLFPKYANNLKTYIKKNKLNLKKEEDLILIFQHLFTEMKKND